MKQNKKQTVKKNNAKKNAPVFDDLVEHEFYAKVFLGPSNTGKVEFSVKPLPEEDGHLTFDHVEKSRVQIVVGAELPLCGVKLRRMNENVPFLHAI